ncbi:glycosyltransferase family 2 protein [Allorhodopirellula heiligendammensis]|uniref:Beta-monoglucosyldiacylglycerol synthase n=1 Tax=Allorhodopirellula heiligendammensis TaxID=2714739 RepID=A0A5C6C9E7_9BACT|nr:glycosyltransferase family 2 protein [Allorhodopirellula heiligendammensis]TWU19994.1 Beta-monoglucosyldiacylglycerol synthase [Allorhodopirellula heiligendammensis]
MLVVHVLVVIQFAFWIAAIAFLTPLALYPLSLWLLSQLKPVRRPGKALPTATLVISAYNEREVIGEKIRNALLLDYPADRFDIMVISDASDDGTDDIIREFDSDRVQGCRMEQRAGKSAGLSRFCPSAAGDILVFTDANSMFHSDALSHLLCHFDAPEVGYSVGRQLYIDTEHAASCDSENIYWSFELLMKQWESRLSSVVGADGAIYALRKEHFAPLAAEDINDFLLPLQVIAKGFRGVFDYRAVCFEKAAPDFAGEFRRKKRIVNRSLYALLKVPAVLNPFRVGWFAWQVVCHKLLRWLCPLFMVILLATSAVLSVWEWQQGTLGIYSSALLCQLLAYALAGLHRVKYFQAIRLVYVCYYFLMINVASAQGIWMLARGQVIGKWKPER